MEVIAGQPIKKLNFFEFPRVSTGAHPLTKKPEDSGYEIANSDENFLTADHTSFSLHVVCGPLVNNVSLNQDHQL